MQKLFLAAIAIFLSAHFALAETGALQTVLQENRAIIEKGSRKTIEPAIAALANSKIEYAQIVLQRWQAKEMWQRKSDGFFVFGKSVDDGRIEITDLDTGAVIGFLPKAELKQLKPNSGVRAMIGAALVQFQLSDPDPELRRAALTSIQRDPDASQLEPLRASIDDEPDAEIRAIKLRLERLLTISFDQEEAQRVTAIEQLARDVSLDVRATLNPLLETQVKVFEGPQPDGLNVAQVLLPGSPEFSKADAYQFLVDTNNATPLANEQDKYDALVANIVDGKVGDVPVSQLGTQGERDRAYEQLVGAGKVTPLLTQQEIDNALNAHSFVKVYDEPSSAVTFAAENAMKSIQLRVGAGQFADLTLDALSLASIFFLAAIGLAITFGVMGVINMAHGEFIMLGAYTGYVTQQIIPNYTVSILVALPLAFIVTFAAGVAMERLVIRWLYNRPLETLLATFGISISLQQIAKNIFGTQARPLTSPAWLDGAWVLNDVVSISYIRIAIFILALIFLMVFLFVIHRTRLGLETRAVTQNPTMAASMGINPDKVNMLTFGLGSGIAGVAGIAIGLFAKVTSELGNDYIVQSFMTVVVGGVGNIWGTLAGATMIGFMQKGIEWANPSNTLAAQTYMIVFIIIFIQFRPRGIIALRGRAAGD